MQLSDDMATRLSVYCAATSHDHNQALARLLDIALTTWETDPYYMPERVCGRVRDSAHTVNQRLAYHSR